MKKENFLFYGLTNQMQYDFAKKVSVDYGNNDCAVILFDSLKNDFFKNVINFRQIVGADNQYAKIAEQLGLILCVDDIVLNGVLSKCMQNYNMLCRQYGYKQNISLLERVYMQGISFWNC